MLRRARSFEVRSGSPERVAEAVAAARANLGGATGGIVFVSGLLAERQHALASLVSSSCPGLAMLIAGGSGVLSERGEIEGESAATGLLWAGGSTEVGAIDASSGDTGLAEGLEAFLSRSSPRAAALVFVRPGGFTPRAIQSLGEHALGRVVVGGGALGEPGVIAVGVNGQLVTGRAVALSVEGLGQPTARTTYSCRLLGPLRPITESDGPMVLRLGDEPALNALTRLGQNLEGSPLVFTVLSRARGQDPADARDLLVRGVQGIDPGVRGLMVSDEVEPGMLMTFGVRDAHAARFDLERLTREVSRDMAGAAPLCALYVNCGGRGRSLYGRSSVDTRIMRERFGQIPMAGMQSSFEIAPHGEFASFQLYTGVVTMFSAPS